MDQALQCGVDQMEQAQLGRQRFLHVCISCCPVVTMVTKQLTFVTPDLALLGNAVASQSVEITLGEFTEDHTTVVDDITSLVDSLAFEDRVVDLGDFLLRFLVALGMANSVAVLVATV